MHSLYLSRATYGGLCVMPACGQTMGCGACDTPELWRGAAGLCAPVRACAGAAESLHTYTHTYLYLSCTSMKMAAFRTPPVARMLPSPSSTPGATSRTCRRKIEQHRRGSGRERKIAQCRWGGTGRGYFGSTPGATSRTCRRKYNNTGGAQGVSETYLNTGGGGQGVDTSSARRAQPPAPVGPN